MKRYGAYIDTHVTWLSKVPSHWKMVKLKHLCLMQAGKNLTSEQITDTGQFSVYGGNGIRGYYSKANFSGTCCIIGRQGALCGNVHRVTGSFWATEHAVLCVPKSSILVDYLYYLLQAMNLNQYSSDSAAQPGLAVSSIVQIKGCLPPRAEQDQIVHYLDWQVSKINRLIAAKKKTVALLRERQSTIITSLVLGQTQNDMKGCDGLYIKKIPSSWRFMWGKQLFKLFECKSTSGKEELLTVSHLTGITPRSQKDVTMFKAESLVGYKICEKGDIAENTMWAWQGAIGVSTYYGVISPAYNVYRQKEKYYDDEYLDYLLRTKPYIDSYRVLSTGIRLSRLRLYPDKFLSLKFPVPTLEEQKSIITELKEKVEVTNQMIATIERENKILLDLRARLISDVVTGKIDVRNIEVPAFEKVEDEIIEEFNNEEGIIDEE